MKKIFTLCSVCVLMLAMTVVFAACGETKYTVTFNKNTTATVTDMPAQIKDIKKDTKITAPTKSPSLADHDFGGWYKEAACTNIWNFATENVTKNTTLYAKWTPTTTIPLAKAEVTSSPIAPTPASGSVYDYDAWGYKLDWEAVPNAASYTLLFSSDEGASFSALPEIITTNSVMVYSGGIMTFQFDEDGDYQFAIRANASTGYSNSVSDPVTIAFKKTDVKNTAAISYDSGSLTWTSFRVSTETGYANSHIVKFYFEETGESYYHRQNTAGLMLSNTLWNTFGITDYTGDVTISICLQPNVPSSLMNWGTITKTISVVIAE